MSNKKAIQPTIPVPLPVSSPENIYQRVVVIKQQIAFLSSQRPWA